MGLLQQTGSLRWTTYRLSAKAARTPKGEEVPVANSRLTAGERQERIPGPVGGLTEEIVEQSVWDRYLAGNWLEEA